MSPPDSRPRRLPLVAVIQGAFMLPWMHRVDVLRNAGIPLAVVVVVCLCTQAFGAHGSGWAWFLYLLTLASIAWLAITVHRLVLLDAPGSFLRFDAVAMRRFVIFLFATLVVFVAYHGLRLILFSGTLAILGTQYVPVGETRQEIPVSLATLDDVASALSWILLGRLSMIFPALATDQKIDFVDLWRMSRGNALRLAVVAGVLPAGLSLLLGQLAMIGVTRVMLTVLALLMGLCLIVEVTALSLSYRALTAPAPPTTDPPA